MLLTSRCRDTATKRDEGDDVLAEERAHALNEFPPDTRVTANEGVHANEDRTTDPGLGHARRGERVHERQDRGRIVDL